MAKLGEMNRLEVVKIVEWGVYLDGGPSGEILLPNKLMKRPAAVGDWINVFVYLDSDDRWIATTRRPAATVHQFAYLKVVDVNPVGAFLDWGLQKDVLCPFDEQKKPMRTGERHIVYLYLDKKTRRITASSKVDRFVKSLNEDFEVGMAARLLVHSLTDIGYKCIVNNSHWGILFYDDVFEQLSVGQTVKGYIKTIRDDKKIDLSVTPPGYEGIEAISKAVLAAVEAAGGFVPLTDKSPPADIYARFGVSKQAFKKAVGSLYKQRLITLEQGGIRRSEKG